jgi:cellulose synthase/poly-beta-1,6-N-acetylglucosamine synthase-like glycosyltransferase
LKKLLGKLDCIHVTPGPFALYKTQILKDVGYFVEDNLTEDLEMALRLQKHNYGITQLIDTYVYTIAPEKFTGWYKQRNRWYKGTLINLFNYRKFFFNTKYGEFGFFQIPMTFISALLSIFFAIFVLWKKVLVPIFNEIYDLSYINFDYPLMAKLWFERFNFIDVNTMLLYFLILIISFAFCWIGLAHKYTKYTYSKTSLVNTLLYVLVYPIFLSIVWLGIVKDLILFKIQKW